MPHVAIEFLINLYSILFSLTHTMDSYYASLRQHKGELGKVSMENNIPLALFPFSLPHVRPY